VSTHPTTAEERVTLLTSVYEVLIQSTESLEDDELLGPDFAYLVGAILKDTGCAWPADRPFIRLLRAHFTEDHAVWNFIQIEEEDNQPSQALPRRA